VRRVLQKWPLPTVLVGWYREVHAKSLERQRLKNLLAARKALLRRRIDLENEMCGLIKVYGFKLPAHLSCPVRGYGGGL
jgi:transposase